MWFESCCWRHGKGNRRGRGLLYCSFLPRLLLAPFVGQRHWIQRRREVDPASSKQLKFSKSSQALYKLTSRSCMSLSRYVYPLKPSRTLSEWLHRPWHPPGLVRAPLVQIPSVGMGFLRSDNGLHLNHLICWFKWTLRNQFGNFCFYRSPQDNAAP